jgi:AraC-like DNA-binding protein
MSFAIRCGRSRNARWPDDTIRGIDRTTAAPRIVKRMARSVEEVNRRMLRARDAMDRAFAEPLDIARLAQIADVSEAHFIRTFKDTFSETPHRYLQRRRVERAMFLLRSTDRSVTDICFDVGFNSLGTFSRTFTDIVGQSPVAFRQKGCTPPVPTCFMMAWTRPSSFGEARRPAPTIE